MQIFAKYYDGRTITLNNIEEDNTILEVKGEIYKKIKGFPPDSLRIILHGKSVEDGNTIKELNIVKDTTVMVVPRLESQKQTPYPKELFGETLNDFILEITESDQYDKTVAVISGSSVSVDRKILEPLVIPDSKYSKYHDIFRQQLPLPILLDAYENEKNVHIFLIDHDFDMTKFDGNVDVREVFNNIREFENDYAKDSTWFFEDELSNDYQDTSIINYGHMVLCIGYLNDILIEVNLTDNRSLEEKGLLVNVYILPYTITEDELNDLGSNFNSDQQTEYIIYLKNIPHQRLEDKNLLTNYDNINKLKEWHSNEMNGGGKFPNHYTAGLSRKDKKKQQKNLKKSTKDYEKGKYTVRPRLKSFKSKKSNWTSKFEKKYGKDVKKYKQISKVTGIPVPALKEVVKKGMGAYYSSGSRPNQTPESWGKARMYSYIMGGPTRKIDHHITEKYKVKFP